MKISLLLLVVLASSLGFAPAASTLANFGAFHRSLLIDPSSMPVEHGTATLTIGALRRTNGVYCGKYRIKVSPYFFKNEKGTLAIIVSDASLAEIDHGKAAAIIGTATTSGWHGKTRHIDAIATPANIEGGRLKLWFMAGDRKMIFNPAYHFAGSVSFSQNDPRSQKFP